MKNQKSILAIGAHPDDIEMGCGGTLIKHLERGDNVYILILTDGEKGHHSVNRKECLASLNELGIKDENIFFSSFSDGTLPVDQFLVNYMDELIAKLSITRIYTHSPHDRHQDHRNCSLAASSAARRIPEIFLYQGPSTQTAFTAHYYISLSENHMAKKLSSLSNYQSQIQKGVVNLDWIKCIGAANGILQGKSYAEAFEINHLVKDEDEI